ncbi:TrmH family RNA methyltransferase [Flavobacterium silvaticum]|uniref:RNA methyltransferase n=1 Tax=Flavobacterium silvaticum TaxID=1852020 RepID=A0A972FL25_9FLAO|nr:RNA methyltransferase [Flavobacterium silvaticum]NMH27205.1 RNA methyltransferase [Flavobacterium silvaticum]
MVSKNQIKRITSLKLKKYREQEKRFTAEGVKVISELLLAGFKVEAIYVTETLFGEFPKIETEYVTAAELSKMTALSTANNCLAVFEMPDAKPVEYSGLIVALDEIRDPGNLGTIIRLCDWFGINQLVCSPGTADIYNPKVVQATMGSLSRVNIVYSDLTTFLIQSEMSIFGTFMDGKNIYEQELPSSGIIVMGNEANGISAEIEKLATERISIPRFGNLQQTESLNVATATAIVLSEFRRK